MRLWAARRRRPDPAGPPTDDLLITEDLLRRNVDDLMTVHDRQIQGHSIVFRGDLRVAPTRALDLMLARFKPLGYTPFLRGRDGHVSVQAVPLAEVRAPARIGVNVVLFLLTCLSTLVAGALFFGSETLARSLPYPGVAWLLSGVPFAATLILILGTHEFGHYFAARYHRTAVSLPYFIPAPPPFFLGTFGAVIRMRSPAASRNVLFDIAAAGPIAGLVVAIPAILLGLGWSTVGPVPPGAGVTFGDSLMMRLLVYARFGPITPGSDVFIHPIAIAGWVGLLVTALNLFPVGQLDGGRIAYALFGAWHRLVGKITFVGLLALGAVTQSLNWFVWAALLFFLIGFDHSPPLDDVTPLSPRRRAVGALCLILLVLLIPPVPIHVE